MDGEKKRRGKKSKEREGGEKGAKRSRKREGKEWKMRMVVAHPIL